MSSGASRCQRKGESAVAEIVWVKRTLDALASLDFIPKATVKGKF